VKTTTKDLKISVGTLAIATRQTGVCDVGEVGVCYEVYELSRRPGYSFIFEGGRYDGFSPDEVERFLKLPNVHCLKVSGYEFRNVLKLCADFRAGVFAPAFELWL
jgi:hypothetical protein